MTNTQRAGTVALMATVIAAAQPMPPMTVAIAGDDEIELFSTTLTWNAQPGMTFRLVCGTNVVVTTGTTGVVWTTTGTFPLSIVAISNGLTSAATSTNLVVGPRVIVGVDLVASKNAAGPWMVTNLPPPITNPAGAGYYFKLREWKDDRIWRELK